MKMSVGDSDLKIGDEREFMLSLKLTVDKSVTNTRTMRVKRVTMRAMRVVQCEPCKSQYLYIFVFFVE